MANMFCERSTLVTRLSLCASCSLILPGAGRNRATWSRLNVLSAEEDQPLLLEHPRVFFPSYPWEWTPGQWVAAGELTLELCGQLLREGWILKDATPLNILFDGARPVFIDLLSIERRDPRSPLWLAYGQFARTFLLPLAALQTPRVAPGGYSQSPRWL